MKTGCHGFYTRTATAENEAGEVTKIVEHKCEEVTIVEHECREATIVEYECGQVAIVEHNAGKYQLNMNGGGVIIVEQKWCYVAIC